MRPGLAIAACPLLLLAAACSAPEEPVDEFGAAPPDASAREFRPSRTPLVDFDRWAGVDLPVVPTAGVIPSGDAVVLTIGGGDADAAVNGVAGTWDETRARLRALCDLGREAPGALSEISVLIVADRATPWGDVARALQTAADQNVAAPYVAFVVRIAEDGACGTFATFLPEDSGLCEKAGDLPVTRAVARIRRAPAGDGAGAARPDMTAISAASAAMLRPGGVRAAILLEPDLDTPLQVVLDAAEAAERGGARILQFTGVATIAESPQALSAAPSASPPTWMLELPGGVPPKPWPPFTPRGRVDDGFGGFATPHSYSGFERPPK
jgi:hypothetical protein